MKPVIHEQIARVMPGTALAAATVAAIVAMALSEPSPRVEFSRPAMEIDNPFLAPERSAPIPVDPDLVHPGWCRPSSAPICQEV